MPSARMGRRMGCAHVDGTVEQVTNYYPFGTPYSDGTSTTTT